MRTPVGLSTTMVLFSSVSALFGCSGLAKAKPITSGFAFSRPFCSTELRITISPPSGASMRRESTASIEATIESSMSVRLAVVVISWPSPRPRTTWLRTSSNASPWARIFGRPL
jgi:hypothetical protein